MACVYLVNCENAKKGWESTINQLNTDAESSDEKTSESAKKALKDPNLLKNFVKGALCSSGAADLTKIKKGLGDNFLAKMVANKVQEAINCANQQNVAKLYEYFDNSFVKMGVKLLSQDDKNVFDFVKLMLEKAK